MYNCNLRKLFFYISFLTNKSLVNIVIIKTIKNKIVNNCG